jgi:hypothetical protein
MKDDLYGVNKYVMAQSAKDALKNEKKFPVAEVYIHPKWFDANKILSVEKSIDGFKTKK